MNFLGLLIFHNPLKENTKETIVDLNKNDYDCCMITGDSLDTAISVGYYSNILNSNSDVIKISLLNNRLQFFNQ